MDSFFYLPIILFLVSASLMCGCVCLCVCFAQKQGRFPTVNRNGLAHGMVNRSGPAFGVNRSAFGSGAAHNTPAYNEMINDNPPFGFAHNNFPTTQNNPPIGSTDNDTTVNTYGWTTTHTTSVVNELPPSYSEVTGISAEPRHQSQNGCDIGFRSHIVKDDSGDSGGKCASGGAGDSSYTGDSGGDSGGDTGGGDSGDGDTTKE